MTCTSFTNGTISNAELNYLNNIDTNIKSKFTTLDSTNTTQNNNITALQTKTTQQSYTTGLTSFVGDLSCNAMTCTSFTNGTVSDAELNYLNNIDTNIKTKFTSLDSTLASKRDLTNNAFTGTTNVTFNQVLTDPSSLYVLPISFSPTLYLTNDANDYIYGELHRIELLDMASVKCSHFTGALFQQPSTRNLTGTSDVTNAYTVWIQQCTFGSSNNYSIRADGASLFGDITVSNINNISDTELNYLNNIDTNIKNKFTSLDSTNTTQDTNISTNATKTTDQSYASNKTSFVNTVDIENINSNAIDSKRIPTQTGVTLPYTFGDISEYIKIGEFVLLADDIDQTLSFIFSRGVYNRSPFQETIQEDSVYFKITNVAQTTTYYTSADHAYGGNFNIDGTTQIIRNSIANIVVSDLPSLSSGKTYYIYGKATYSLYTDIDDFEQRWNFASPASSVTFSHSIPIPTSKSGYVLADKIIANNINCKTRLPGVIMYNGGSQSYPGIHLYYSAADIDNTYSQDYTTGGTGYSSQSGAAVGQWSKFLITDVDDLYLVYPNYGIIAYDSTSYTGSIKLNFKNTTDSPVIVKPVAANQVASFKIYFDDVEQTK